MNRLFRLLFTLILCVLIEPLVTTTSLAKDIPDHPLRLRKEQMVLISKIIKKTIRSGKIPGAVVLIGKQDRVLYRRAFGHPAIKPKKLSMTIDTIFDLASLTKVVATTTALMQLVEEGKLCLEDPVAKYWPEFKASGKENITVRELLTHYSGLRPDLDLKPEWSGYDMAIRMIIAEKPMFPPGTNFVYSDINFIILGELVHRIAGQPLDVYCVEHIFRPLGMKDTGFKPSPTLRNRIAPTQYQNGKTGKLLRGEVHDPTAYKMGGVAGHAGLFSTANDLSIFAQMLLSGGSYKGARILSPLIVEKMTTPQTPLNKTIRGLGWDIESAFTSNHYKLSPIVFYGHKGFTGTAIWIDPVSKIYIIVLTNRVHPYGKGDVRQLRAEIKKTVAKALVPISAKQVPDTQPSLIGYRDMESKRNGKVQTGIDVLEDENFKSFSGLRDGLITNHSGIDSAGRRTLNIIYKSHNVKLAAIFSPEHGLYSNDDYNLSSGIEQTTSLPVYNLYGDTKKPTEKMLNGLDALVFDIQDVGVRFFTYITTMGYAMEAAARKGIAFYVLDRPNPISGSFVQGPIMEKNLKSFVGYFPMPVRHGMTVGELAKMFKAENKINVKLHIIKMRGYERTDWYDETGLPWVNPSPNLRTLTEAILYPGVALVEGSNVSVGRGTNTPFELLGAPWIHAKELAEYLNNRKIQGVRFMSVDFTPASSRFKNEVCHGVQIILVDRQALDSTALGVEIAAALYKLFPGEFQIDKTLDLIGARWILQAIKDGQDPCSIVVRWQKPLEEFRKMRSKYLLY
ncbi:MAG: DUF1343 domain-containing protein [Nitrospirota bacterium]|nr:DUF1343 domain-containing protein [Nitrospirota bacterium]